MQNKLLTSFLILISFFVISCENKVDTIKNIDLLTLPSVTVKDDKTIYIDSGRLQLVMSTPIMEQYNNVDVPYYEFKSGIKARFFKGENDTVGSISSKYAKYTNSKTLWELKDSVVVINEGKDKLETEVLFWDQQKDIIYTDRFVKITSEDQIVLGTGFESNSNLTNRKIKKVKATLYLKNNEN